MRTLLGIALVGIALGLVLPCAATAGADRDPAAVAAECISHIRELTGAARDGIGRICARTIGAIEERQAAGDREGARAAARAGVARVNHAADRAKNAIADVVRGCLRRLRSLGADRELMQRVVAAGRAAAGVIDDTVARCLAAIRAALSS